MAAKNSRIRDAPVSGGFRTFPSTAQTRFEEINMQLQASSSSISCVVAFPPEFGDDSCDLDLGTYGSDIGAWTHAR